MKKSMKFIIIIWALLIIGALIYFNKDKLFSGMNYTSLGYSETSSEKIKEFPNKKTEKETKTNL